jgi:sulfur-carrier protein
MAEVTVRYWAAARAAAGHAEAGVEAGSVRELVDTVAAGRPELRRVLGICSFLVDGARANAGTPLTDGAVVDVLPPFAGG